MVLGDVAGRGIPAASTMGQLRSVMRAFALPDGGSRGPEDALTRLNRHQLALGQQDLFTVIYAIIDPSDGTVSWANAGHPPPLVRRADGETRVLPGGEGLMGFKDVRYECRSERIGKSDTLVFYTDGLVERRGESLDVGITRLAEAVSSGPSEPRALCNYVLAEVLEAAPERHDDVTVLLARLR